MRLIRRDPGLWLLLHLRRPRRSAGATTRGRAPCVAPRRGSCATAWVLPRDLARDRRREFADRESRFCAQCGANRRRPSHRRSARLARTGTDSRRVVELVREDAFRGLAIAEINSIGRMHPFLADAPGLVARRVSGGGHPGAQLGRRDVRPRARPPRRSSTCPTRASRCGRRAACCGRAGGTCSPFPSTPRSRRPARATGLQPEHHGRGRWPFRPRHAQGRHARRTPTSAATSRTSSAPRGSTSADRRRRASSWSSVATRPHRREPSAP